MVNQRRRLSRPILQTRNAHSECKQRNQQIYNKCYSQYERKRELKNRREGKSTDEKQENNDIHICREPLSYYQLFEDKGTGKALHIKSRHITL